MATRATKALILAHDYIVQDNPKAAKEFFRYAIASAERLVQHPQTDRTGRVPSTRELVLVKFPYIIPYRVRGQEVQSLHVFHGSRVWPSSF